MPGSTTMPIDSGVKFGLEERRVAQPPGTRAGRRAGRGVGQIVVAHPAVALCEVAIDVVAQARVEGQAAADPPVVLHEPADIVGQEVPSRIPLVEVGTAAGRAMPGKEERPVAIVQVSIGASHVLAFEVHTAVLDAGLERVPAAHQGPAIGRTPDALDVPEVPGIADAAGVALRIDVDGRHQRRQAADGRLERVVDAERRVEDVAVLRDACVLQVEVADVDFVEQARAEGVAVRHATEPRRRSPECGRRRGVRPAEGLVHILAGPRERGARLVGDPGAVLH